MHIRFQHSLQLTCTFTFHQQAGHNLSTYIKKRSSTDWDKRSSINNHILSFFGTAISSSGRGTRHPKTYHPTFSQEPRPCASGYSTIVYIYIIYKIYVYIFREVFGKHTWLSWTFRLCFLLPAEVEIVNWCTVTISTLGPNLFLRDTSWIDTKSLPSNYLLKHFSLHVQLCSRKTNTQGQRVKDGDIAEEGVACFIIHPSQSGTTRDTIDLSVWNCVLFSPTKINHDQPKQL